MQCAYNIQCLTFYDAFMKDIILYACFMTLKALVHFRNIINEKKKYRLKIILYSMYSLMAIKLKINICHHNITSFFVAWQMGEYHWRRIDKIHINSLLHLGDRNNLEVRKGNKKGIKFIKKRVSTLQVWLIFSMKRIFNNVIKPCFLYTNYMILFSIHRNTKQIVKRCFFQYE